MNVNTGALRTTVVIVSSAHVRGTDSMDAILDVIESNYQHARMRAMRTLYARDADATCARHEISRAAWRPATLGGLTEPECGAVPSIVTLYAQRRGYEFV